MSAWVKLPSSSLSLPCGDAVFVRVREVHRHPDNFLTKYSADLQSAWNIILSIDNHTLSGLLGPLLSPFSSCGALAFLSSQLT